MAYSTISPSACSVGSIPSPSLFGIEVVSIDANLVTNFSQSVPEMYRFNHAAIEVENAEFCNITISYTHPGIHDTIVTEAWLPTTTWNGRLLTAGGGGWLGGRYILAYQSMAGAIGEGYMTITTDAGHSSDLATPIEDWALISPGNIDQYALYNFGSITLNETAYMAKALAKSFYGQQPKYSYFSGCSQGGRQGLMLAQRYPEAYDGIAASAPAIHWGEFISAMIWPQIAMNIVKEYPPGCIFNAFSQAAIRSCDGDDGVVDGIVYDPFACHFDPFTMVGDLVNCSEVGGLVEISEGAALIMNMTWTGPRGFNGEFLWYGQAIGSVLTGGPGTPLDTVCSTNGDCVGQPNNLPVDWLRLFIAKDPNFNISTVATVEQFVPLLKASIQQYDSIIGTTSPDLSAFREKQGKIMGYHGLADETIMPGGSRHYYDAVTARDANVQEFYRLYESPGLGHCFGGTGAYPNRLFDSLVAWVENGTVPLALEGLLPPDESGFRGKRLLCPYPQMSVYNGHGDVNAVDSYSCM